MGNHNPFKEQFELAFLSNGKFEMLAFKNWIK